MTRLTRSALLLTISGLALGACTTSLQTRVDDFKALETVDEHGKADAGHQKALQGVSYALPMRQYDIVVKRQLASCNAPLAVKLNGQDVALGAEYFLPTFAIELGATATGKLVEGERYLVDYEALRSGSKITDFKIEYHEGTRLLKSLNASADDQTGDVIAKTLGAAAAVAGLVFAPGPTVALAGTLAAAGGAAVPQSTAEKGFFERLDTRTPDATKMALLQQFRTKLVEIDLTTELKSILQDSSTLMPAVDCADPVREGLIKRSEASTEIKRLSTGDISAEWQALGFNDANGKPLPIPAQLPDKPSLTDLNERISALLPYIGVRPVPELIEIELPRLLAWQARVIAALRSSQAKREAQDLERSAQSTMTWPQSPKDRRVNDLAPLTDDGRQKLAGLVQVTPEYIIDPHILARKLAASTKVAALRAAFPDFVGSYVAPDNSPLPGLATLVTRPSCYGSAANEDQCLATLGQAWGRLQLAANQFGAQDVTVISTKTKRGKKLAEKFEATAATAAPGLFVRPPVEATLYLCKGPAVPNADPPCQAGERLNKIEAELVPQMGQLRLLPLINKEFANNGLSVALAKDGRMTSFTYASKRAIAAAIAASVADAGNQAQTFKDNQAKRQTTANAARIADLQYQLDLADKQKKVDALGKPPAPKSAQEKQAEADAQQTVFLQAELLRLITQQCRDRALANPTMPTACPAE